MIKLTLTLFIILILFLLFGCATEAKVECKAQHTPAPHGERGIIQQWKAITQPEHDR